MGITSSARNTGYESTMKLPITFNRRLDLMAIKWFIKVEVVYWSIELFWRSDWMSDHVVLHYTRVMAWELQQVLGILGYEVARNGTLLTITGLPFGIHIAPNCLGFLGGGFFLFLAALLTLPSPTPLRARVYWLIVGSVVLTAINFLRIIVVIIVSYSEPSSFELFHNSSMDVNLLAGGILALVVARSLSLKPMGIKVFRRSKARAAADAEGVVEGKQTGLS
jgi:exosortase/archaeosortase family protein